MSLPQPNSDATVVVTGASSGIGTELARGLARRGYPLLLTARRRERLSELSDELRAKHSVTVEVMPLDLRNRAARAQLIDRIGSAPIAGLCNSAGFGTSGPFHRLPVQHEREEITVNALALMELIHAALPEMVDRGAGALPAGSRQEVCYFQRCDSSTPRASSRPLHRHRRFMLVRGSQIVFWVSGLRVQDDH